MDKSTNDPTKEINNFKNQSFKKDSKKFKDVVGITLPIDGLLSVAQGYLCVDIIRLDSALNNKFNYMDGKTSMSDFLTKKFGQKISDLVERNI